MGLKGLKNHGWSQSNDEENYNKKDYAWKN